MNVNTPNYLAIEAKPKDNFDSLSSKKSLKRPSKSFKTTEATSSKKAKLSETTNQVGLEQISLNPQQLIQIQEKGKEFAEKAITNLKKTFKLIEKENELYWNTGTVSTGQNIESLKETLTKISNLTKTNRLLISVRLKAPNLTCLVTFNVKGSIINVAKKNKMIGQGTYGNVYCYEDLHLVKGIKKKYALKLAKTRNEGKLFSLKAIKERQDEIKNEMRLLISLHKNKIVPGLQPSPTHMTVVLRGKRKVNENEAINNESEAIKMGYFGKLYDGDATVFLDPKDGWNIKNIFYSFQRLAEGLNHCHENKTFHGDIKPENTLVFVKPKEPSDEIKSSHFLYEKNKTHYLDLADFGGGIPVVDENSLSSNFSHTWKYVHANHLDALEKAIREKNVEGYCRIREKMDLFSFGATLYYLLTFCLPYPLNGENTSFSENNPNKTGYKDSYVSSTSYEKEYLIENIVNCLDTYENSFEKRKEMSEQIGSLIHSMVSEDLENCPTSKEVLETIKKINFLQGFIE